MSLKGGKDPDGPEDFSFANMTQLDPYSCLRLNKGRYWGYFLASSFLTLGLCLLLVFSWRFLCYLIKICCKSQKTAIKLEVVPVKVAPSKDGGSSPKGAQSPTTNKDPISEIGWMTEAKDWAGQLISGQTTTGRVLVSGDLRVG